MKKLFILLFILTLTSFSYAEDVTINGNVTVTDTGVINSSSVAMYYYDENFYHIVSSTTAGSITSDVLRVQGYILTSFSDAYAITTSGIGGLEASDSEASNTWYEVYVIVNPTSGASDILLNEAATAIGTPIASYTLKRLVGYAYNDTGDDLLLGIQYGNEFNYGTGIVELAAGRQDNYTSIDLKTSVPPKAFIVSAGIIIVDTGDPTASMYIRANGAAGDQIRVGGSIAGGTTGNYQHYISVQTDAAQIIEYKDTGSSANLKTLGYTLNLGLGA